MSKTWRSGAAGAVLALMMTLAAVAWQPVGGKGGGATVGAEAAKAAGAKLRLLRTRELRQGYEAGVSPATASGLAQSGLPASENWLLLDLVMDGAPEKARIVSAEFVSATARDDLGADLVGPAMKRVEGRDPTKTLERWSEQTLLKHDHAPALCWYLAAPERGAKEFTANLVVRLELSGKRDQVAVPGDREWHPLEHPSLRGLNARARVRSEGEILGWYLEVEPREAAKYLMWVRPSPPQFTGRAHWSSADRNGMSYKLAKHYKPGDSVEIDVMAELSVVEAEFAVEKQRLP